jgi:hypothetical protein
MQSLTERHAQLLSEAEALVSAEADFLSLSLPGFVSQALVERVKARVVEISSAVMSASQASENSAAMLDLLAARSLLGRLTTFVPTSAVRLASTAATPTGGAGATLSITGGPWFIGTGRTLDLTVNGDVVSIALPSSRPVLRSQAVDVTGLVNGDEISVLLDHGAGTDSYAYIILDLVDTSTLITATNTNIVGTSMVSVDGVLALRRESDSPIASILVRGDTSTRGNFLSWFTGSAGARGETIEQFPAPITGQALTDLLIAAHPDIRATATETGLGEFVTATWTGTTFTDTRGVGELEVVGSVALVPSGITVSVGDVIDVGGTQYPVTAVDGSVVSTSPAIPVGTWPFTVGASYDSIATGTKALVTGNNGVTIWTYVTATNGSTVTVQGPAWDWGTEARLRLVSQTVDVSVVGEDASVPLSVAATTGASALGITPGPYYGAVATFTVEEDLLSAGVLPGDVVTLVNTVVGTVTRSVLSVSRTSFTVADVAYDAGGWTAEILNRAYQAYALLAQAATDFRASSTLETLISVIGPALRGAAPTASMTSAINAYSASLSTYRAALDAYVVATEAGVTQILRLLEERGLDRGVDLLLAPSVNQLLSSTSDDLTYTTWLARTAGTVTRQVAPVSKMGVENSGQRSGRGGGEYRRPFDPTRTRT